MANGVDEIGPVQRVEVERLYPFIDEIHHLFRGDGSRDQMCGRRVVVKAFETAREPGRHARSGADREARHLTEVVDRHDARRDRHPDAGRASPLEEAQVVGIVESELRDDAVRAGVDLGL